ncbi:MAG: hypothetical protein V3R99_06845 [Thermoguttaceae bacterium]
MAGLQYGPASTRSGLRTSTTRHNARATTIGILLLAAFCGSSGPTWGAKPADPSRADTSFAARQSAVRSIPVEKLSTEARAKVASVISNISVFRRMPVRVVDCDPKLYLFLLRHPDVVTNIWEVLKMSQMKLRQVGRNTYRASDAKGTLATAQLIFANHDTHIVYAEGLYEGPLSGNLLGNPVKGRCILVLKSGYVREPNGRYYITTRLDTFIRVDPGGIELLTKAMHPLVGKTADSNFTQTVAFFGSLSRTAEVNTRGVQRLAAKLANVTPETRLQLARLAGEIGKKTDKQAAQDTSDPTLVASRPSDKPKP